MIMDYAAYSKIKEKFPLIFGEIANSYGFRIVFYGDNYIFLLKSSYAVGFFFWREGVDVTWFCKKDNKICDYSINYFAEKFDQEDRKLYGSPDSLCERWVNTLMIWESGLKRHFNDFLSGDINWIKKYPGKEMFVQDNDLKSFLLKEFDHRLDKFN